MTTILDAVGIMALLYLALCGVLLWRHRLEEHR